MTEEQLDQLLAEVAELHARLDAVEKSLEETSRIHRGVI